MATSSSARLELFKERIGRALEYTEGAYSIEDVLSNLAQGKAQLWEEGDSFVITQVKDYPGYRTVNFWLAGGDLEDVLKVEKRVEGWARGIGAKRLTLAGRKGWAKRLRHWKETVIVMARDL